MSSEWLKKIRKSKRPLRLLSITESEPYKKIPKKMTQDEGGESKDKDEDREQTGGKEGKLPLPLGWTRIKSPNWSSVNVAIGDPSPTQSPPSPPSPLPVQTTTAPSTLRRIPSICYHPSPLHPWFTSRSLPPSRTSFLLTQLTTDPCVDCGDGSYLEYEYVRYDGSGGEVTGRVKRTGGTEGRIEWDGSGTYGEFIPVGFAEHEGRIEVGEEWKGLGEGRWEDVGRKFFKRVWEKGVGEEGFFTWGYWVIG